MPCNIESAGMTIRMEFPGQFYHHSDHHKYYSYYASSTGFSGDSYDYPGYSCCSLKILRHCSYDGEHYF